MNIVFRQTSRNIFYTYLGFIFGAVNMVLLYPLFLKDTYFGLVTYITSAANILMPIIAFGSQNVLVKFYGTFENKEQQHSLNLWIFITPLIVSIPLIIFFVIFYDHILELISQKDELVRSYAWLIGILAIAYSYFEIFYAWARIHLKSVYGNFLREIFPRIFVSLFLVLVYLDYLSPDSFVYAVTAVFVARTLLMLLSAFKINRPKFSWKLPPNLRRIVNYSILMISVGFTANVLLTLDKTLVGIYFSLEDVAYYGLAVFISTVIAIPSKSMHLITLPITTNLLHSKDIKSLGELYTKSSIHLFGFSSIIFLLITINLNEFYKLLPPPYAKNMGIVIILCVARLFENMIGNNNAIIFSSDHFRSILKLVLATCVISLLSMILAVRSFGVYGIASTILILHILYHGAKVFLVYKFWGIQPFSIGIGKVILWLILFLMVFYFWDFGFHPVLNIFLKSLALLLSSIIYLYYFPFSEESRIWLNHTLRYLKIK